MIDPLTPADIAALVTQDITDVDEAATWVAVILAESGGNPVAYNLVDEDPTSVAYLSTDNGLLQINSYWHGQNIAVHEANRPALAWRYSLNLATGHGDHPSDWSPWNAYKNGSYRRHLDVAYEAVRPLLEQEDSVGYLDNDRSWYPANGAWPAGDPVVRSSSGARRPALMVPLSTFTVHYIGAGRDWLDAGDTAKELASIERNHAIPQNKPNEYNSASDSEGVTWQWAGGYRAAHSAGENDTAWGHLVVYGLEDPSAHVDGLIAGIRRARSQLVAAGYLTADHRVVPHRNMPGASTGCPGPLAENKAWWARIAAPLDESETSVTRYFTTQPVPAPLWRTDNGKDALRVEADEWAKAGNPTPELEANPLKFRYWIEVSGDIVHGSP